MRNALSKVGDTVRRLGRSRISAALLGAALVALVGGGTAVASGHIGGDDIRNYSIDKQHLKGDSVGTFEVKDRTLGGWDLRKDSVGRWVFTPHIRSMIEEWESGSFEGGEQGEKGEPGTDGTNGTDGQDGADGTDGQDGVSGYEVVGRGTDSVSLAANESKLVATKCASADSSPEQQSEVALGGGAKATAGTITVGGSYPHFIEQASDPSGDDPAGRWQAGGWAVQVTAGADGATVQPYVLCALMN